MQIAEIAERGKGNTTTLFSDRKGTVVKSFGKFGKENGELNNPVGVTVDDKERIVVSGEIIGFR